MIKRISTLEMTDEQWRQARRVSPFTGKPSIGGSDAGALLGFSQYASPMSLWSEKTGKIIPEDISDKEAVRLGNDLEQYVADRFMEATGKKVRKDNAIIWNEDYPYAHANIDRSVVGEKAGLECKTTSSWEILQQCRAGEYPPTWYAQMTHYMMVCNLDHYFLAVLCFGHGFFYFRIDRNDAEIKALADAEEDFYLRCINNTPPELDGSEATLKAIKTIFAESDDSSVDLTPVSMALQARVNLQKQIKELEEQLNTMDATIMQYMGSAAKGSYDKYTVSWKTQQRKTFDKAAFEAANGTIPDKFYKVSESRPFKVSVKK